MANSAETGSQVFKMVPYSQIKGVLGVGKSFNSDVFRVGGHGWCIECYPDGYTQMNADWICLRLRLDRPAGENVEARFIFSLLDKTGAPVKMYTETSSTYTFSSWAPSWGFIRFISWKELESSPYLSVDDDSFSVKCWVNVFMPDAAVALRANRIRTREVREEEEDERGRVSKYDHKLMKEHMSAHVARCFGL